MVTPFVVGCREDAEGLLYELLTESHLNQRPVGLDTETTGCNPEEESPVGKAELWCMTVARGAPGQPPSPYRRAFVPRAWVEVLRPWLEDATAPKVGTNLFGYDRHVFANMGIELRGIEGCTSAMSRLLDPGKERGHSVKAWGERLGYVCSEYREMASVHVAVPGARVTRKRRTCPRGCRDVGQRGRCSSCGSTVERLEEEIGQRVSYRLVTKPLDELWEKWPSKRSQIVEYATQDPAMSLDTYWVLRTKLAAVAW